MKFLGHPIHPLMIHFPTALLPADALLSLLGSYRNHSGMVEAAFYCSVGGVFMGMVSLVTGLIDAWPLARDNRAAIATTLYHGFLNAVVILSFGVMLYGSWKAYPALPMPSTARLIAKGILILLLFVGNYMGASLIYHYGAGLKKSV